MCAKRTIALIALMIATPAWASTISLTLTNSAGEAVTSVTVVPRGAVDATPATLSGDPIPAGEISDVSFQTAEDQCVYDLTINFASGKVSVMPDTDICQTDGIVIQ